MPLSSWCRPAPSARLVEGAVVDLLSGSLSNNPFTLGWECLRWILTGYGSRIAVAPAGLKQQQRAVAPIR